MSTPEVSELPDGYPQGQGTARWFMLAPREINEILKRAWVRPPHRRTRGEVEANLERRDPSLEICRNQSPLAITKKGITLLSPRLFAHDHSSLEKAAPSLDITGHIRTFD